MNEDRLAYDIYIYMCEVYFKNKGTLIRYFNVDGRRTCATSYSPCDYVDLFKEMYTSDYNNNILLYKWIRTLTSNQFDYVCRCETWNDMRNGPEIKESLLKMYWLIEFPLGRI